MRVILDTNVLVSAVFFGGIPNRLLESWAEGGLTLVISPLVFEEYQRVGHELARRYPQRREVWDSVLAQIATHAMLVTAHPLVEQVSEDPDDDKFLACAKAAKPSLIVSGDRHLLKVSGWNEIEILTPRQFHDRHLK